MESINIVSCAYKDRLGDEVTATEYYGLSNFHVELYITDAINLYAQLISAQLNKQAALLLTNTKTTKSTASRATTAADNTYRTQRA